MKQARAAIELTKEYICFCGATFSSQSISFFTAYLLFPLLMSPHDSDVSQSVTALPSEHKSRARHCTFRSRLSGISDCVCTISAPAISPLLSLNLTEVIFMGCYFVLYLFPRDISKCSFVSPSRCTPCWRILCLAKVCHASKKQKKQKKERTTSQWVGKYGNLMDASCQPLYSKKTVTQKR